MSSPSVTPSSANLSADSDKPVPSPFKPQEWSVAFDTNKPPTYTVRQSTNGGYQYPGPFLAVCSDMPPNSKMFCATGTSDGITRYGWQIGPEEDEYAHGTVLEIEELGQEPDRAEKIRALTADSGPPMAPSETPCPSMVSLSRDDFDELSKREGYRTYTADEASRILADQYRPKTTEMSRQKLFDPRVAKI
jgi:hypothetical protein